MYTNVVYFNHSKGKAAKNNADKAKTLVCGKVKNDIQIRRTKIMSKFVCSVCGYVYEGEAAPKECPICHAPAEKFNKVEETAITWADEHKVGVAEGLDEEVVAGLRENFNGECSEVGMYYEKAAYEEAEHAAKFAELLGEVVTPSTKKNLEMRYMAENGACEGKMKLAKRAKELGYDAIHDTVHEMAKDEARHGCGFKGLLDRYFANK